MTEVLERTSTQQAVDTSPVRIRKLGHVVFRVRDVDRSIKFYTEILNFRVSDVNEQGMVFFNTCGDHHTLAVAPAAAGDAADHPAKDQLGLSHFAMEVASIDELIEIRDFMKQKGVKVTGEGRKGAGCNIGLEFEDPDGYHLELYCNMDQIGANNRTRPPDQWHRVKSLEEARDKPIPATW
jgi:catechol 2,3-dioxygenase-like lactoylglutathione lyase family enzyme